MLFIMNMLNVHWKKVYTFLVEKSIGCNFSEVEIGQNSTKK